MPQKKSFYGLRLIALRCTPEEYVKIRDSLDTRQRVVAMLAAASVVTVPVVGTLESDKKPPTA